MLTDPFWLDCLSNLIATIAGIAIGLPIAMWLDRVSRRKSDREKEVETRRQLQKLLSILLGEVNENLKAMEGVNCDVANNFHPVQMESWRAFSDGGELKWISDPALIHELSLAYGHLSHYSRVLDKYFDEYFLLSRSGNTRLADHLFNSVLRFRDIARKSNEAAVKSLMHHISKTIQ
jgi:hypothetical protein